MTNIKDLLYKRILVMEKTNGSIYRAETKIIELKILEISPSEKWIKVQNEHGNKYWKNCSDIIPIEILGILNSDKPTNNE